MKFNLDFYIDIIKHLLQLETYCNNKKYSCDDCPFLTENHTYIKNWILIEFNEFIKQAKKRKIKMERLTQKNEFFDYILPEKTIIGDKIAEGISICLDGWHADQFIVGEAIKQFGIIEDTLEKHNIESIESLDLILQGMKKVKQENADLQHRLEMTEKALELACNYLVSDDNKDDELYKLVENIYDDNKYLETKINYFKEQAEKELKGE